MVFYEDMLFPQLTPVEIKCLRKGLRITPLSKEERLASVTRFHVYKETQEYKNRVGRIY
jgi:hypothetical protein